MIEEARSILKRVYGYDAFKQGQEEAITHILNKQDTMVIMPTGGGKSICYQIPALLFDGVTMVISPLISLMKDQVDALDSVGIQATYINSMLTYQAINQRLDDVIAGKYDIIYVAPERLETESIQQMAKEIQIAFVAVDEAHCVSQWGHDFRPSYRAIHDFIEKLPERPVVAALTATATERVQADMIQQLKLQNPALIKNGYNRENLTFTVLKGVNKHHFIVDYTSKHQKEAGIIYAGTRKETEKICKLLLKQGLRAGMYHGGMGPEERKQNQEKFLYDDVDVMVATNAFGMGIDKSNVRYVIHYNMPENIEAYYQEAGRAGRDGLPSNCILLFGAADVQLRRYLIDQSEDLDDVRKHMKYEKLQQMTQYAHVTYCLRKYILAYFGDEQIEDNCDNCSNCNGQIFKEDMTIEAQKIISCVVRMKERFGTKIVAEVLKGSKNKRVLQLGFHHLSTYGLLSNLTIDAIKDRINLLIAEGYLHMTYDEFPIVKLTKRGMKVLKGMEQVYRNVIEEEEVQVEEVLFEQLRQLRREIASKEHVPPYVVFSDASLRDMCKQYPMNQTAMLRVKGVGEAKFKKYGQPFIDEIAKYVEAHQIQVDDIDMYKQAQPSTKSKKQKEPSCFLSAKLFLELQDLSAVAKERAIQVRTVENHIFEAYTMGFDLDMDQFIPEGYEEAILETIKGLGTERLKPIKEASEACVTYNAIKAVIAKHGLT